MRVDYSLPKRKQQDRRDDCSYDEPPPFTKEIRNKDKHRLKSIVEQELQISSCGSFAWPDQLHYVNVLRQHDSCETEAEYETKNREQRDGMNKGRGGSHYNLEKQSNTWCQKPVLVGKSEN